MQINSQRSQGKNDKGKIYSIAISIDSSFPSKEQCG